MTVKNFRHHISLDLIVPTIFAGIALLSALLTFLVLQHYHRLDQDGIPQVHLWALLFALGSFFCGLGVTRLLLRPIKRFMLRTKDIPVIAQPSDDGYRRRKMGSIEDFDTILERVADVLGKLDARHLFPEIIGDSRAMRGLLEGVRRVARTDSNVLILGERGTGKGLLASSIHNASSRKQHPFVKLNCAAIPADLLAGKLFGLEKGDFTGTKAGKPGKLELADGGTLFLDAIGDMPLEIQAKMLRLIQEKEFERVGGMRTIRVDVRIICATNKDLVRMVAEGAFREDLYYRINVLALNLPALRERKEDIPRLVEAFLSRSAPGRQVTSTALQLLLGYSWPGNLRELHHTLERAAVSSQGRDISAAHLPAAVSGSSAQSGFSAQMDPALSLDDNLRDIEKGMIIEALKKSHGVQVRAAEELGINQRSLWHRIKKYQIEAAAFKANRS